MSQSIRIGVTIALSTLFGLEAAPVVALRVVEVSIKTEVIKKETSLGVCASTGFNVARFLCHFGLVDECRNERCIV
jgi:hypothetical protein